MYDVLPMAIHVFLRMNLVGEHQACHFVHQNMGAVDVMSKVATEIDAFVKDLNTKTLVAAKDTDQSEQYTKFTDVLQYDPMNDNTYVPGLWDGSLPMAKTNVLYSKTMYQLKLAVITSIKNMKDRSQKSFLTFEDFTERLKDLWDGIKFENFVFSFRNVLAVEAHRRLASVFNQEQWALKREFREMKEDHERNIEWEIMSEGSKALRSLVESSKLKLLEYLDAKIGELRIRIQHYFQCPGCLDCNAAVKNRHLLANNEKEFEDEVNWLKRTLERELDSAMEELEVRMDIEMLIQDMDQKMNEKVKSKVRQILSLNKSKEITREEAEIGFKHLWEEMTQDAVRSSMKMLEREENIRGVIQDTIKRNLGPEYSLYRQKKIKQNKDQGQFKVKKKHIKTKKHVSNSQHRRLEYVTENIIFKTSKYYNPTHFSNGKKFNKKDVEQLFKDILEQVADMQEEEHMKITDKYKVGLLYHVEKQAVKGFTELHKKYCDESSPAARLKGKMQIYYDIFTNKMGQGDNAVSFCNSMVRHIILSNINKFLGPTRLLDELRKLGNDTFKDVKTIQASIIAELVQKDRFDEYLEYIINHEMVMKSTLKMESVKCLTENDLLKNLVKEKLEEIVEKIVTALQDTSTSEVVSSKFMSTFMSSIVNFKLRIPLYGFLEYLDLDIQDTTQFADILRKQIGELKDQIVDMIDEWNITQKVIEKDLPEFLMNEIVGCRHRCPFCQVPCDVHSGGKTQGKHSATMHRPLGLVGVHDKKTGKLLSSDCCFNMASNSTFIHGEDNSAIPYLHYRKVYPDWKIDKKANPDVEKIW